jgi:hypothetical protein
MINYYIEKTYKLFLKDIDKTLYNESFFHDILLKHDISTLISCCFVFDKKDVDILCWYVSKHISFREIEYHMLYDFYNKYIQKYNDIHIGIFTYLINTLIQNKEYVLIEKIVSKININLEDITEEAFPHKHYMINYYKMLELLYTKLHKDITKIHQKIIDITFCESIQKDNDIILIQKKEHNSIFKIINPSNNILAALLEHKNIISSYHSILIFFTNMIIDEKTKFIIQHLQKLENVKIVEKAELEMIDYLL